MFGATKSKGKVFVGLSGGVDSAVSAALLQQQGYDVVGVFIRIALPGYPCSAGVDKLDAMRVAAHLRIPFMELDLSHEYEAQVFKTTLGEYRAGRTPNPDTLCNREIKFGTFYDFARARGADFIATGHYAQIVKKKVFSQTSPEVTQLHMSVDTQKDQSYFLWMVPETALQHVLFPIGALQKPQVRALATKFGLPNAARKDSQGLCFLGDVSISAMLTRELQPTSGDVVDEEGTVVGTHEGAALYTLGQRHGFVLHTHDTQTVPHFVVAKNMHTNTIVVADSPYPTGATATHVLLREVNWIGEVAPGSCEARYRYRQTLLAAELLEMEGASARVRILAPRYVPEGQSLVLYRQGRCLGGGIVASSQVQ